MCLQISQRVVWNIVQFALPKLQVLQNECEHRLGRLMTAVAVAAAAAAPLSIPESDLW